MESLMQKRILAIFFGALLFPLPSLVLAAEADNRPLVDEARKVASRLLTDVRAELMRELEASGPVRAIIVCKYSAPELSGVISREKGMRVARVSLRPRNPMVGAADVWEQKNLLDFERRITAGEKAESLERSEVVVEPGGRYFRYMKAIPMGQPCLACHGTAESISEAVRAKLASEYPHDNSTNYRSGQLRGAVSIKKQL